MTRGPGKADTPIIMFTGLVESLGVVSTIEEAGAARHFWIEALEPGYLGDGLIGESISVNGTCLTATEFRGRYFRVTAVEETLRRTTLGQRKVGDKVNLERALLASARLGGHIVQGHVDGVAQVTVSRPEGAGWWVTLDAPPALLKYIVEKGSVCLDGVSLTVAQATATDFSVALIPHTREVTTAGTWEPGVDPGTGQS